MTLLEKYLNGDGEAVYKEIRDLGSDAFSPAILEEVNAVLNETFRRVRDNLEVIYQELQKTGYQFLANKYEDNDKPLVKSAPDIEDQLQLLEKKAYPMFFPLSIQFFYRYVGGVDFTWDWESFPDIPWEGADPLVIPPINFLLDSIDDGGVRSEAYLCPDDLQKDNVSGDAYYLCLADAPVIDTQVSSYDLEFIQYLRLTLQNGGFSMADQCDYPSLDAFSAQIRSKLSPI